MTWRRLVIDQHTFCRTEEISFLISGRQHARRYDRTHGKPYDQDVDNGNFFNSTWFPAMAQPWWYSSGQESYGYHFKCAHRDESAATTNVRKGVKLWLAFSIDNRLSSLSSFKRPWRRKTRKFKVIMSLFRTGHRNKVPSDQVTKRVCLCELPTGRPTEEVDVATPMVNLMNSSATSLNYSSTSGMTENYLEKNQRAFLSVTTVNLGTQEFGSWRRR